MLGRRHGSRFAGSSGDAWTFADYATVTARHAFGPSEAYEFIGFRTVLPLHPAG